MAQKQIVSQNIQLRQINYQFQCLPSMFPKIIMIIGIFIAILLPIPAFYIVLNAPHLKIPSMIAAMLFFGLLVIIKNKWRNYYQFMLGNGKLVIYRNNMQTLFLAFSQIFMISLKFHKDGHGNNVCRFILKDTTGRVVLSIQIINGEKSIQDFMENLMQLLPMVMRYKDIRWMNALENIGEHLGGAHVGAEFVHIEFLNSMHLKSMNIRNEFDL